MLAIVGEKITPGIARWTAWFLVVIYFILSGIGLYFQVLAGITPGFTTVPILLFIILVIVVGIWPVIGALIISHHPRHLVGWLLFLTFPIVAIDMITLGYASYATIISPEPLTIPGAVLIWLNWSGMAFAVVCMTLMNLFFPNGSLLSPRWRVVVWTSIASLLVYLVFQTIEPGQLSLFPSLDNPYGVPASVWAVLKPFYFSTIGLITLCNLAGLVSLFLRLRRAFGTERQQVKWLVIPATIFWIGTPIVFLTDYDPSGIFLNLGVGLHVISVPAIVLAVAVAIFKYRLYDIDTIINRTLVYGALTAVIVALYLLMVGGAGLVIQTNANVAGVLITAVIAAAIYRPARHFLQRRIDRFLYGPGGSRREGAVHPPGGDEDAHQTTGTAPRAEPAAPPAGQGLNDARRPWSILRGRLFEVDFLINRSLFYGAWTLLVLAIYGLVLGVLGLFFPAQDNLLGALLATGMVAVLFQPLREKLQRAVNRLLYGERDDPLEVLSRLGKRLETGVPAEHVLFTLVETIAQALKLPFVGIALSGRETARLAAQFGNRVPDALEFPLSFQGTTTGRLLVAPRRREESFKPAEMRLLRNLARQAGAAVRAAQLTADLQFSRQQLVTTREEERLRLRRDLHDGLGPALASVVWQIDSARELVVTDPAEAVNLLESSIEQAQMALADIRRLVYGLRPPALDELGLVGALQQAVGQFQPTAVIIDAPEPLPSLPAAVEVAAYRIVQESLKNAVAHGKARKCRVCLTTNSRLNLTISDDGLGLPATIKPGIGLLSMRERAEELGGSFEIQAAERGGTAVAVSLPLNLGG